MKKRSNIVKFNNLENVLNYYLTPEPFFDYIHTKQEKMNIDITRNLLNELEEKDIKKIKENLFNKIEQLKQELLENQKQLDDGINKIDEINKTEEKNNGIIEELTKKHTQKTIEYEEIQKKEEQIKEILSFHRIEYQNVFNKQDYFTIIQEKQMQYKRKVEELEIIKTLEIKEEANRLAPIITFCNIC